jgi:hypothetical protein
VPVGSNDALCRLIDGFSAPDQLPQQNATWPSIAPAGFGTWLRPEAFKTFVVVTDDDVQCTTSGGQNYDDLATVAGGNAAATSFDTNLRNLSAAQFETPSGDRDYIFHSIVNVPQNTPPDVPYPATSPITTTLCTGPPGAYVGPGTGYQALSRLTGGLRYPSCRFSDFNAVFNAIAQEVIDQSTAACTFELNDNPIDFSDARVSYTSSADEKLTLSEVVDVNSCAGGGWYLEQPGDQTMPPIVSLCPSTCSSIQADPGAQVFVEFGCELQFLPTTFTETYEADCEAGTIVEWKALGYDTTMDGYSRVEFRARTAASEGGLAGASYHLVATAMEGAEDCVYLEPMPCQSSNTNCTCVSGIGGGVEFKGKLDPGSPGHDFLELEITVVPTPDGSWTPTVHDWRVAYSCLPGE